MRALYEHCNSHMHGAGLHSWWACVYERRLLVHGHSSRALTASCRTPAIPAP